MKVELEMTVRGGARSIRWDDGVLSGDDEVLGRLQRLIEDGRVQIDDLVSVLRAAELVTAQRVTLTNLDLVEPEPVDLDGRPSDVVVATVRTAPLDPFDGLATN